MLIYGIVIIGFILALSILYYFKVAGRYKDTLYQISRENAALDKEIGKANKEIKKLLREENELNEQCLARGGASWEGFSAADFGGDSNPLVDFFLNNGKISERDLARAEAVCTDSDGQYTIEETLVLLDMVSKADIEWAKKRM